MTPFDEQFLIDRLRTWMTDPDRRQANVAFTAGLERQLAYLIEDAERRAVGRERQ